MMKSGVDSAGYFFPSDALKDPEVAIRLLAISFHQMP